MSLVADSVRSTLALFGESISHVWNQRCRETTSTKFAHHMWKKIFTIVSVIVSYRRDDPNRANEAFESAGTRPQPQFYQG